MHVSTFTLRRDTKFIVLLIHDIYPLIGDHTVPDFKCPVIANTSQPW